MNYKSIKLNSKFKEYLIGTVRSFKRHVLIVESNGQEYVVYCYGSPWIKDVMYNSEKEIIFGTDDNIKYKAVGFKYQQGYSIICPHVIENCFGNLLTLHGISYKRRKRYGSYIGDFMTKKRIIEVKSVLGSILNRGYFPWPVNSTVTNKTRNLEKFIKFVQNYKGKKKADLVLIGGNTGQKYITLYLDDYNLRNDIAKLLEIKKLKIYTFTMELKTTGEVFFNYLENTKFI